MLAISSSTAPGLRQTKPLNYFSYIYNNYQLSYQRNVQILKVLQKDI